MIELLAVIAIIGVLATYVLVRGQQARERARIAKAQAETDQLRKAITLLGNDTGEWPGHTPVDTIGRWISLNEVWDLTTAEAGLLLSDGNYTGWAGPYMRAILSDPWGNPYFFDPDYDIDPGAGEKWVAVVGSFGPNGIGQNVYDEDNIYAIVGTK